jgi:hypothetical protein
MNFRIRLLYILTIIASVTLLVAEAFYVYAQYGYTLQQYQREISDKVINVFEEDYNCRKSHADSLKQKVTTVFSIQTSPDTLDLHSLSQIQANKQFKKVMVKKIDVSNMHDEDLNLVKAMNQFRLNTIIPMDSLKVYNSLTDYSIPLKGISFIKTDSTLWKPISQIRTIFFNSEVEVVYPTEILNKKACRVIVAISVPKVLDRMIGSLIGVFLLTLLLATCLILQILTIKKQRKIDEMRRDYIHSTIHELKRPLMALKLCISFVRNEKMMQSESRRSDVLSNASDELNNLSSYFAKMRDVVMDEQTEIPLRYSSFPIYKMLQDCCKRQVFSSEKHVDLEIVNSDVIQLTADYDNLSSAICNLIENAMKYSKKTFTLLSLINFQRMI